MKVNKDTVQLINTAILKSKEKHIDLSFEKKLEAASNTPAMKALDEAVSYLSDFSGISRDQAALQIVELIVELDELWEDYVLIEGLSKIKEILTTKRSR